jgi:hypothetical protein
MSRVDFQRPQGVLAAERQRANGATESQHHRRVSADGSKTGENGESSLSSPRTNGNAGTASPAGGSSAANAGSPTPLVTVTCGHCQSTATTTHPENWKVAHHGQRHFGQPWSFTTRGQKQ